MRHYFPALNAFVIILFCFGLMLLPPLVLPWCLHDGAETAYGEAPLITAAAGLVLWQSTRHGKAISVELPNSVVREIIYTEPAIKGDTSGKVMKTAKIKSGFELPVPLFCEIGDKIEIDTRTADYRNRVKG